MRIRCLACSCVYETDSGYGIQPAPCPRRYFSPHTEEHMQAVVDRLVEQGVDVEGEISPEDHLRALKDLRDGL